jgi:hypothetical protein
MDIGSDAPLAALPMGESNTTRDVKSRTTGITATGNRDFMTFLPFYLLVDLEVVWSSRINLPERGVISYIIDTVA